VAKPWTAENYPEDNTTIPPPGNRAFQGEFRINYTLGDFPPTGQIYRMPFNITATSGGFDEVTILNAGVAVFEKINTPATRNAILVEFAWTATGSNTDYEKNFQPFVRISEPYLSEALGVGYGPDNNFNAGEGEADFGWPDPLVEAKPDELSWTVQSWSSPGHITYSLSLTEFHAAHPAATLAALDLFGTGEVHYDNPLTVAVYISVLDSESNVIAAASFNVSMGKTWTSRPVPPVPFSTLIADGIEDFPGVFTPFSDHVDSFGTVLFDLTPGAPPELMITTPI
jgi:hypothetical protein